MRYRRRNSSVRIIVWLVVLGVAAFAVFRWGGAVVRFVTGQDILTDLAAEVQASQPTGAPGSAPADQTTPVASSTISPEEIGPDGFPVKARQHVLKYIVQPGDSLFAIAERFHLNPNTIFWANTDTLQDNVHLLYVGVQLYILPVNGVYHLSDGTKTIAQIAAEYGVAPGDILGSEFNELAQYDSNYTPPAGLRIVVPGGQRQYLSWQAPIHTGAESGGANPEGTIHPGSCREHYQGVGGSGGWINPLGTTPYRVTNGFEPWHPGVDMAAERGTPVYAADTGVVVFAGWHRDGYGELIIIDHGDGWTTYYGHLLTRFVGCGDQVTKGQYIAQMGMSGNATGFHLHFEIRKNDVPQNPYLYIEIHDRREGG